MSIRYGEDVFRSVELPLIRALLDLIPMAAQHTSALHDVENRFNQTVGAEAAGVFIQDACKKIWVAFAIQNEHANQKVWRDAIAENRLDDAAETLKQQYEFTAAQAACAVAAFQQFIPETVRKHVYEQAVTASPTAWEQNPVGPLPGDRHFQRG